jgi:RNA polymerase sigma-70 factor, ECF subfamily
MNKPPTITDMLQAWERGEKGALEELMPPVMQELRKIAKGYMRRESRNHTLQTTGLINEAYIRLVLQNRVHWHNRSHFYALAAQCMRRALLDYAKSQYRLKRGGCADQVRLSNAAVFSPAKSSKLIALDEALSKLAEMDERKSCVVEMRYFGGYTIEEIAGSLQISQATVARDWRMARAWLRRELRDANSSRLDRRRNPSSRSAT